MKEQERRLLHVDGTSYVVPFIIVTLCFVLWGIANDITNPMVKAFSKIFRISVTGGALIQVAFYGGYCAMALPAAIFIRKYNYKTGLLMGIGLYATGALLFLPASWTGLYAPFLVAYFIMTCGLSFLETTSYPYVLAMGPQKSAVRRLNLAQCFNPIGSLIGMWVAMTYIQKRINPTPLSDRLLLSEADYVAMRDSDLNVVVVPYLIIGVMLAFALWWLKLQKMPSPDQRESSREPLQLGKTIRQLLAIRHYREGIIAQFFYVGAQIMCWTFILQYGTRVFMLEGIAEVNAEVMSQKYNIIAMMCFVCGRFIYTFLLRYVNAGVLLASAAMMAIALCCGVVLFEGRAGLYALVAVSACMSLMYPTIYATALADTGHAAKIGSAGLVIGIAGGALLPPLQAMIIDLHDVSGMPAENLSFVVPMVCFAVVVRYGLIIYYTQRQR